ncbi:MAG: VanZ family protein [Desulfamplus sp.]|nr:VanZ family protein [Desulfamplus sp.]
MEVIQINLEGHTPESTDPFFVLLIAFWLKSFRDIKYRPEIRDPSARGKEEYFDKKTRQPSPTTTEKDSSPQNQKIKSEVDSQILDDRTQAHPETNQQTMDQEDIGHMPVLPVENSVSQTMLQTPSGQTQERAFQRAEERVQPIEGVNIPTGQPITEQTQIFDPIPTESSSGTVTGSIGTDEHDTVQTSASVGSAQITATRFYPQLSVTAIFYFSVWAVIVLLLYWFPYDFIPDKEMIQEQLNNFNFIPFYTYYENGIYYALIQILGAMFFFMPNGVILSYFIKGGRLFEPHVNRVIMLSWFLAVFGVAGLVELGQFFLPERVPDMTDILIGSAGSWFGFFISKQLYIQPTGGE